jgi:hypothetical protein
VGKSYTSYLNAFKILYDLLGGVKPTNIVFDFEFAAFKAINTVFENVNLHFCNFHLGQNFYRNFQKNGPSKLYNSNSEYRTLLQMVLALAYEKPDRLKIDSTN